MAWPVVLAACLAAPAAYFGALAAINGWRRPGEPPLIRGAVPYLGAALPFGRDAMRFLDGLRAEHGEFFTVFIGGRRMTFALDPMAVPALLKAKQLSFAPVADEVVDLAFALPKVREYAAIHALERASKDFLKGAALSPLTARMEAQLDALLPEYVDALTPAGQGHAEADLYRFIWDLMFAAGTDALYGQGVATPALSKAFDDFDQAFPLMLARVPDFIVREGIAGREFLVAPMAASTGPEAPAQSEWMAKRAEIMAAEDPEFRGRIQVSVLWAAHANTIPATFWAVAHLLRHPEALAAVRAELEASEGLRAGDRSTATLDQLRHLDSAIRESLRLSSGSLTLRLAAEDCELELPTGRFRLRKDDQVAIAPFLTHRDPEIFPDPEAYQHDRFYVEKGVKQFFKAGKRVPMPLMPFGAGVSMCPGRFFAVNEIKLCVTLLLSRYDLELVDDGPLPGYDLSRVGLGIYPPSEDVRVRITARG